MYMTEIFQIFILIFSLYGIASLLWEINEKFIAQKNRNTVSYLAFLPLGGTETVEREIRSCIDYAQEMACEPVILCRKDWSEEKLKIASLIAEECDIAIHMI